MNIRIEAPQTGGRTGFRIAVGGEAAKGMRITGPARIRSPGEASGRGGMAAAKRTGMICCKGIGELLTLENLTDIL